MKSGVAKYKITDWEAYKQELINRLGLDNKLIRTITQKAKQAPKRVVFAEADHYKILKESGYGTFSSVTITTDKRADGSPCDPDSPRCPRTPFRPRR